VTYNIRPASDSQEVVGTGGEIVVSHEATVNGLGTVPFTDNSITNLTSMAKLVDQGCSVYVNTDEEDAIKVKNPEGDRIIKFERSENGLYFHDTQNRQIIFLNSQKENSQQYTKRQVAKAKEARNLYQMIGYPSINDFKNAIKYGYIQDCPITVEDINIAEDIFGKDIYALKGKTVRRAPYRVEIDHIRVPPEILKSQKNVIIGFDFLFINGQVFFVTVSRNIKFSTIEWLPRRSLALAMECLGKVINLYNNRGFTITDALGDDEFTPLKYKLKLEYDVEFNDPAANEHVGDIERMIRTIKERICAALSSFPWKKSIPRVMIRETAKLMVKMAIAFSTKKWFKYTFKSQKYNIRQRFEL